MALAQYTSNEILNAIAQMRGAFQSGELSAHEFRSGLCRLNFRDRAGDYWAYDGVRGCWYRFDGQWIRADRAPDRLEGPDWLMAFRHITQQTEFTETVPPDPTQTRSAKETLGEIARYLQEVYVGGDLSSDEIETLLAQQYLYDRRGRAWTVGVRTGKWYHFENGGWVPADQAPEEDALARLAKPAACDACSAPLQGEATCPHCATVVAPRLIGFTEESYPAVLEFLVAGAGSIPERLADPWNPPAWFPEAMYDQGLTCNSCGAANSPASLYCNRCGAVFASLVLEPPEERVCPLCKAPIKPGKRFCVNCGAPLTAPSDRGLPR